MNNVHYKILLCLIVAGAAQNLSAMEAPRKNYYAILKVEQTAGPDAISRSYSSLAQQLNPNTNRAADAKQRFDDVVEAYAVLNNPVLRREYDSRLGSIIAAPKAVVLTKKKTAPAQVVPVYTAPMQPSRPVAQPSTSTKTSKSTVYGSESKSDDSDDDQCPGGVCPRGAAGESDDSDSYDDSNESDSNESDSDDSNESDDSNSDN